MHPARVFLFILCTTTATATSHGCSATEEGLQGVTPPDIAGFTTADSIGPSSGQDGIQIGSEGDTANGETQVGGGDDVPGPDEPETLNDGQGSDGEVVEPTLPPELDRDEDGVPDDVDNCDERANPNQNDADQDGRGDACDVCVDDAANDQDSDTVCGATDNCPAVSNPQQTDTDGDGLGDACDLCPEDSENDADGDMVCETVDNCPGVPNSTQEDEDQDGSGDACDACPLDALNDGDNDSICDDLDNCLELSNPQQLDGDGDGLGDLCDACPIDPANDSDSDMLCAPEDNCPDDSNPEQLDGDEDGLGDVCDPCPDDAANVDTDADGICDPFDNCPLEFNSEQEDADNDGLGDACEPDSDGDGLPDDNDLFPDDIDMPGTTEPGVIYPHTSTTLFKFLPAGNGLEVVGTFTNIDGSTVSSMTDMAADSFGTLYGITFGALYTCHPQTAVCASLGPLPGSYNGLTMVPPGTINGTTDTLVAITTSGAWYSLSVDASGVLASPIGGYGTDYSSSGDVYSIANIGTYAAVNKKGESIDYLVQVDPLNGTILNEVGPIGTLTSVWGLAGWQGRAYAFDSSGTIVQVDLYTGLTTWVMDTPNSWWGAGVQTQL